MFLRTLPFLCALLLLACSRSGISDDTTSDQDEASSALDQLITEAGAQERADAVLSLTLADSAFRTAEQLNDIPRQARAGSVLLYAAVQLDSLALFERLEPIVIELYENAGDGAALAHHLRRMGDAHYRKGLSTQAEAFYSESIRKGIEAGAGSELAETYSSMGSLVLENGTPAEAIALQRKALTLLDSIGLDSIPRIRALSNLAQAMAWAELPDSAIHYHEAAIALIGTNGNQQLLAWNILNLGTVYIDKGRYEEALVELQRAHDLHAQANMPFDAAASIYYMAYCHEHVSPPSKVISSYERVIAVYDSLDMPHRSMVGHSALGRYLIDLDSTRCAENGMDEQERNRIALDHCRSGLAICRTLDYPSQLGDILDGLCDIERVNGDLDSAMIHAQEAIKIRESTHALGRAAGSYLDLGRVFHAKGELRASERAYLTGLERIRDTPNVQNEVALHDALQLLYADLGRYALAYDHLRKTRALTETNLSETKRQDIVERDLQWQFDRKQLADSLAAALQLRTEADLRVIAELRSESAETRTWIIAGGGAMLLVSGTVLVILDRRRRREAFAKQAAQLEIKALRAQMNPHFLFNALNSIGAFIRNHEPEKAHGFIAQFARLVRLVLENSRKTEVPLKSDLEALELYVGLEQARTQNRFAYLLELAPGIDPETVMVPPMVIQPFVENAIWHGLEGKEHGGEVVVAIDQKDGLLRIVVRDNGCGLKRAAAQGDNGHSHRSVGTTITTERLDLLAQQKGERAGWKYVERPIGTEVEIRLPI
ncbi:MAG: histidine kinase [Flavobacteriales bacterium]|nr:histidine kinase [Flavobacteriales bacterium]